MLGEALGPVNSRLADSHFSTEWPIVTITSDMDITADGRAYALLSESERWRVDAMIAETIAHLSGEKLLVLDRVDVLDIEGREDLLFWLDELASSGQIETALLFATLKALPANLPDNIEAVWICLLYTSPALLRDLNRQLSIAGTALAAKDERACRLQLGLMLDNLRIEFEEVSI